MTYGKFIVFEGIDGCGKATQLKLAHAYLWNLNKEIDMLTTREPTRDFKEIREKMERGTDVKDDKEWYAKQFISDRLNHCESYIDPALGNGTHVLCDRYKHSTLTYQHTQGMDFKKLVDMHKYCPQILTPDLTLIYDCPAKIAFKRRQDEGAIDVFDKNLKFQEKLRKNYLKLPKKLSKEKIIIINATPSKENVFKETKKHLDYLLT
ncbi:dTMP kinase [Candidatus Pacearchaeota archaeon]|jgi:dTMP kinase|nr:dTMP kinase [Candidatus Pacearchaeota archaeon]|tara:strand:+ start:4941 stop:5561 length:621 start_codon:yes stop_codon:yes gene_type:complete